METMMFICDVEVFLTVQDPTFFRDGIAMFKHRWTKYIDVEGD